MEERLNEILQKAAAELKEAADASRVEELRVRYLGKKGELSSVLGGMGKLLPEQRRQVGEVANRVKAELEELLSLAQGRAEEKKLLAELSATRVDVTLPGRFREVGRRHPVSAALSDIVEIFGRMGFGLAEGPEVELDFYNFEAVNFPKDHPARDMQDTFWVKADWLSPEKMEPPHNPVLLRTHTSPVQVRAMLASKPPIRIVVPGRVYRRDSDLTHTPMFHQVEGLYVNAHVTMAELKGTMDAFAKSFFGAGVKSRFRPSFFPFTEPSAEMDISCVACRGQGCRVCKNSGWLEVGGAGMVHPNVLAAGGCNPEQFTGFAFGMGVERLAMLRHGIDDLRKFFENDVRFLEQF